MQIYNIHDAKTNLSRLIEEIVNGGEPFVIAKSGKPLVKVVLLEPEVKAPLGASGFLSIKLKFRLTLTRWVARQSQTCLKEAANEGLAGYASPTLGRVGRPEFVR